MKKLLIFAAVLMLLMSCATPRILNTATEKAICDAWKGGLFLPSMADTQETAIGLTQQQKVFIAACGG